MHDAQSQLVSVVIPTYNHARYLGKALQSVLDQTYTNWEVIVVDNHSTDHTDEILADFMDQRITCMKIHNNGVIAASRNAGMRAAKGDWIAFLDSDDWWTSDKLEICFKHINDQVDLVFHDLKVVRDSSSIYYSRYIRGRHLKKPVTKDLLLNGNPIANSSVIVRASLIRQIGLLDESSELIAVEDYNAWLGLSCITENFLYIQSSLGYYLFHGGGGGRKSLEKLLRRVCRDYLYVLNTKEKITYEATSRYIIALNDFYSGRSCPAVGDLVYSICYGKLSIRFKSLVLYLLLLMRNGR